MGGTVPIPMPKDTWAKGRSFVGGSYSEVQFAAGYEEVCYGKEGCIPRAMGIKHRMSLGARRTGGMEMVD